MTVTDGDLISKNEVYVNIISSKSTSRTRPNFQPNTEHIRKIFQSIPGINNNRAIFTPTRQSSSLSSSEPHTNHNQKYTYVDHSESAINKSNANFHIDRNSSLMFEIQKKHSSPTIKLTPVVTEVFSSSHPTFATTSTPTPSVISRINDNSHQLNNALLSIIFVVCGFFVVATIVAIIAFRKHFCTITKFLKRKSKEEITKKATLSTVSGNLTEDSQNSFGMHQWLGPIAYNNRYVPVWEHDNIQNTQVCF